MVSSGQGTELCNSLTKAMKSFSPTKKQSVSLLDSTEPSLLHVTILCLSVHVVLKSITVHDLWVDMNVFQFVPNREVPLYCQYVPNREVPLYPVCPQ